jgi:magnesium chelatase subunit I
VLYASDFILVGSMNPEEGFLRPQIQDRFGLRVLVDGLEDSEERLEVYRRVRAFREHPHRLAAALAEETLTFGQEVGHAREILPRVELEPAAEAMVLGIVQTLGISSHRAEITALEAARAHAAADGRTVATVDDVQAVAPMALRQRRSEFMADYFETARKEDQEIQAAGRELGAGE